MDLSTWVLFGVMTLLGFDHIMMATPALLRRDGLFYTVVAVQAMGSAAVVFFGMPGFSAVPMVTWLISALLAYHAVQNWVRRPTVLARFEEEGL